MFVKLTFVILCLMSCLMTGETKTPVRKCSGDFPFPLYVQIEDCEDLPCEVTKGTVAGMDMQFVALKTETQSLRAHIRATVFGITIPFPLPGDSADVCKNLLYGAYCPLYAEEDVTYHIDLPLDGNIPEVSVRCEVKIYDDDDDVVSCFIADLKVKKP